MKRTVGMLTLAWLTLVSMGAAGQAGEASPELNLPEPRVDPRGIEYKADEFAFARIQYVGAFGPRSSAWATDFPEADIRFVSHVSSFTGLPNAQPIPVALSLTDPNLSDYPFIYMVEPGELELTDDEVGALGRYLMDGGFLMLDDFWGEREWTQAVAQFQRVFPGRAPLDLPMDHEIFTTPYPVTTKPMLPNISQARRGEAAGEQGATEAFYRAILDDTGRVMVLLCHNTDFGDAWEWSLSPDYPREIIEDQALPLSLNIAVYAMTH